MRASTRSSRASRGALALFGLGALACASAPLASPPRPLGLVVGTLSDEAGKLSFGEAFHDGADGRYESWSHGVTTKAFPACLGSAPPGCLNGSRHPQGADMAHVLAVEAHGAPHWFVARKPPTGIELVHAAQLPGLGRQDLGDGGSLRYLWLMACNVLAHGPEYASCPGAAPGLAGHRYAKPACFDPAVDGHANAVDAWRPVLAGSGLRMVCGGVTTIRGTEDEAEAMWEYLDSELPPADAFILGALVQTDKPDVAGCLARGLQKPEDSPLFDPTFTQAPNPTAGDWYHFQYPAWIDPGTSPPPVDSLAHVLPLLDEKSSDSGAGCGDFGACGAPRASPAQPLSEALLGRLAERYGEARTLGQDDERLSRRPRLFDMRVDSFCLGATCGIPGLAHGSWARQQRLKTGYAVFDRVVRVCLREGLRVDCSRPDPQPSPSPSPEAVHEHGSGKAALAKVAERSADVVVHEIPELGAGGRVVATVDARGAVTRVWRHLPPVAGPWRPQRDERVVQPREARERAAVELRARLGRGEVAADARLETWGFRAVGGELRPFYVFEYVLTSPSAGTRVERIEVAALLRGASDTRQAHAH